MLSYPRFACSWALPPITPQQLDTAARTVCFKWLIAHLEWSNCHAGCHSAVTWSPKQHTHVIATEASSAVLVQQCCLGDPKRLIQCWRWDLHFGTQTWSSMMTQFFIFLASFSSFTAYAPATDSSKIEVLIYFHAQSFQCTYETHIWVSLEKNKKICLQVSN